MGCFRGRGGAGNLLSKAIFWLLFMATTVTARLLENVPRSVSSTVQESLLSEEVAAWKEIASALNRNVEVLSNNWSWIKVGLLSFGVLFVIEIVKIFTGICTGVCTQYFVDLMRPTPQEDRVADSANSVAGLDAQQAAAQMATATANAEENQTTIDVNRGLGLQDVINPFHKAHATFFDGVEKLKPEEEKEEGSTLFTERVITAGYRSRTAAGFLSD